MTSPQQRDKSDAKLSRRDGAVAKREGHHRTPKEAFSRRTAGAPLGIRIEATGRGGMKSKHFSWRGFFYKIKSIVLIKKNMTNPLELIQWPNHTLMWHLMNCQFIRWRKLIFMI